jgi:hypothetical protein
MNQVAFSSADQQRAKGKPCLRFSNSGKPLVFEFDGMADVDTVVQVIAPLLQSLQIAAPKAAPDAQAALKRSLLQSDRSASDIDLSPPRMRQACCQHCHEQPTSERHLKNLQVSKHQIYILPIIVRLLTVNRVPDCYTHVEPNI